MAILDRYFTKIEARPLSVSKTSFLLLGYFDTKRELASILSTMGRKMSSACEIHISIKDVTSEKVVDEVSFPVIGKDKGEFRGEKFTFSDHAENMLFIGKYFDIPDHKDHAAHTRYFAEFVLQADDKRESVIISYFSSMNEFVQIFFEVGKKIRGDGVLQFSIRNLNSPTKNLISTVYKCYQDGRVLVPDLEPHYINLKEKAAVQHYALFLWETSLSCIY
ncbi:MAG: hypothetical protein P4L16_03945 [Chlamydiales bacterium]|nr:hypothetical protein [Chlamydiales bacterium]